MKRSGKIVHTKNDKKGRVYNDTPMINGKVPVYLEDPSVTTPLLCDPSTLRTIGFFD